MTATSLHLGYFASGLLFIGLILIPAIGYRYFGMNEVLAFWIAYVLTRPLGASFADWMAVEPQPRRTRAGDRRRQPDPPRLGRPRRVPAGEDADGRPARGSRRRRGAGAARRGVSGRFAAGGEAGFGDDRAEHKLVGV